MVGIGLGSLTAITILIVVVCLACRRTQQTQVQTVATVALPHMVYAAPTSCYSNVLTLPAPAPYQQAPYSVQPQPQYGSIPSQPESLTIQAYNPAPVQVMQYPPPVQQQIIITGTSTCAGINQDLQTVQQTTQTVEAVHSAVDKALDAGKKIGDFSSIFT
ncbi:hypothetical protein BV898_12859 [Hypsibius exemplaris]|uniref:Uncharacterized protein n=1 Tax=Hypsibius exemplaris TaxID=2072580 RepID=A0A1W0WCP1_HYPEX|nr:hypothetical protein BV898_12859 [Hypsibius exemplaris]